MRKRSGNMSRRPENLLILRENPCFEGSDRGTTLVATFSSRSDVVAEPLEVGLNVHPPLKPLPSRSPAKIQFPISYDTGLPRMGHPYEPTLPLLSAVSEALGRALTTKMPLMAVWMCASNTRLMLPILISCRGG